jgi:hypothetical protein
MYKFTIFPLYGGTLKDEYSSGIQISCTLTMFENVLERTHGPKGTQVPRR